MGVINPLTAYNEFITKHNANNMCNWTNDVIDWCKTGYRN